jgi:hypothetical protein
MFNILINLTFYKQKSAELIGEILTESCTYHLFLAP